jgi:hypothetical protein
MERKLDIRSNVRSKTLEKNAPFLILHVKIITISAMLFFTSLDSLSFPPLLDRKKPVEKICEHSISASVFPFL